MWAGSFPPPILGASTRAGGDREGAAAPFRSCSAAYDWSVTVRKSSGVVSLEPAESARAGALLGLAFQDDPLWTSLIPDPAARSTQLEAMFTGAAKTVHAAGGVPERTSGFEAVALWLPPGRQLGVGAMVRSGFAMARFVMRMPSHDRKRMMTTMRLLDDRRQALAPEPHWYLMAIGVEPGHQGEGHGTALMRSGMAKADRDGALIYLETETAGNVGYYEHLGFKTVEDIEPPGLAVPMWLMIRRPRSQAEASG